MIRQRFNKPIGTFGYDATKLFEFPNAGRRVVSVRRSHVHVNKKPAKITNFNAGGKWYTNSSGLMVNAPAGTPYCHHVYRNSRYEPVGVLWESAAQNLFTESETLGAGGLSSISRASASLDADTAPDGSLTADRLIEDNTAANTHAASVGYTLTAASYVFGTHAKAGTRSKIELSISALAKGRTFDLSAGTSSAAQTAGYTDPNAYGMVKLANGWYYCWIAFTGTAVSHSLNVRMSDGSSTIYSGNGSGYVSLWGHQLHLGSGPGSYIRSAGSAGSRTQDSAQISSAFLNSIKAAGYIELEYTPNAATSGASRVPFDCRDGSGNGFILSILASSFGNRLVCTWYGNNRESANLTWEAGTTYTIRVEWNGVSLTTKRGTDTLYGPTDQASGLGTIGATAYLGLSRIGSLNADGSVRLIRAGAL